MPPVVIAGAIAGAATIGGAVLSSGAQKSAAKTAAASQQQATDAQLQLGRESLSQQQGIYNQNRDLLNPFVQRGNTAGNALNALLGLGSPQTAPTAPQAPSGVQTASPYTQEPLNAFGGQSGAPRDRMSLSAALGNDLNYPDNVGGLAARHAFNAGAYPQQANALAPQMPTPQAAPAPQASPQSAMDAFNNFANSAGMQFQLQQGENAINNGYAARGQLQSGAALKALQGYGQQTALNNYFMPYLSLLGGQQAVGAQSGAAVAGVGSNFGNTVAGINANMGNALQNGADAASNAALARGNATANMWSGVGSGLGTIASSFINPNSFGRNDMSYLNGPAATGSFGANYNTPVPVSLPSYQPVASAPVHNWGF